MLCFVCFRIFRLVCHKLHSTGRYSCITAPQLHFYSQHLTRLTNIQTNIQARLELTKQGLQSFFEGHPYKLKQNFPSQTYREWFIKLCACGPNSAASNEVPAIDSNAHTVEGGSVAQTLWTLGSIHYSAAVPSQDNTTLHHGHQE